MYCVAWLRRSWSSARPFVGKQVERVVRLPVILQPESDADEAPGTFARAWRGRPGQLRLDRAVREHDALDHGELVHVDVPGADACLQPHAFFRNAQPQPLLARDGRGLGDHVVKPQPLRRLERVGPGLGGKAAWDSDRRDGDGEHREPGHVHSSSSERV